MSIIAILDFLGLDVRVVTLMWSLFADWWWVFAPPVLFFVFLDLWISMKEREYIKNIEQVLLEVRLPPEVEKTPLAMEQVFAALHGIFIPPRWDQTLMFGEVQDWFSFEMVGIGGEGIHFFIRTAARARNFVESQIYAQYPDAEIFEAEDYIDKVPRRVPNKEWDSWGCEMACRKGDAYPIRTWFAFESPVEEQRIDPIASIMESMQALRPGEHLWIQILAEPADDDWKKEGKALVDKLMRRPEAKGKDLLGELSGFLGDMFGVMVLGTPPGKKKDELMDKTVLPIASLLLSPGEREIVEFVEKSLAKIGYHVRIRWIYIGRREIFYRGNIAAALGFFNQFSTTNLNGFKRDKKTQTHIRRILKAKREYWRKLRLLRYYRERRLYTKGTFLASKHGQFILNIEELATVFHFPGRIVAAPLLPRVEARRGGPPEALPMEE